MRSPAMVRSPCDARSHDGGSAARSPSPDSMDAVRSASPCAASASTSPATVLVSARTSTRRPCSSAAFAVCGPMQATTVVWCGLPAMPTRLRTVLLEVNRTASKPPVLIASRVSAGGGAARTVR